ncbi:hypothetical protein TTHERM_000138019 (macronuclear) [Tetrahymena thermophila SB210]|uniref:MORN motif protein n=1 Tax=Tetrahymena thermophila (strain SB210) TaxID=312017 RepID=W7XAN9_TETTS|nr:hypothetical protein TTHERM_000138019 [Tetrahymena thermophila SB210]EWS73478.1 hypothetical protein TTHERM_000138019 [Tetrahymena thermophila SB210]|eukprot:XP_012653960.1 hypothetical protein TTHERM_000138019 [Tetrahymena thermophila SB210]
MKNLLQPKSNKTQFLEQSKGQNKENQTKQLVKNILKTICQYNLQYKRLKNGYFYGKIINQTVTGESAFLFDSGEFYYGQFCKCQPHGYGVLIMQNGSILKGHFLNGTIYGMGQIEFVNRDIVRGTFENGELVGERIKYNYNSRQWTYKRYGESNKENDLKQTIEDQFYFDQVLADKLGGYKLNRVDESIIIGTKELGCYIICRKDFYNIQIGSFNECMRLNNKGKIFFQNGDMYEGNFKDQKFHGKGVYYNGQDSNWIVGIFDQNQIVQVLQSDTSYPPPFYQNAFKEETGAVDIQLSIKNNFATSKLYIKCLFGKNNQLYQSMKDVNSLKIQVSSSKSYEQPLINSGYVQNTQDQLRSIQLKTEQPLEEIPLIQDQQLSEKQKEKSIKVESLLGQKQLCSSLLQKENIVDNQINKKENKQMNKTEQYPTSIYHNLEQKYQKLDEIIETNLYQKFNKSENRSQIERKSCLKQRSIVDNESDDKQKSLQTFLKLDKSLYKQQSETQNQNSKSKFEESQSKNNRQNQLQPQFIQKQIEQQLQIKIIENSISKSIQDIKPISQFQNLNQANVNIQSSKISDNKSQIDKKNENKEKNLQINLLQVNTKTKQNYRQEQKTPTMSLENRQSLHILKTESNNQNDYVLKTEANFQSQNARLRSNNSYSKANGLKVHMRNHSETIKNMLQGRENSQNSRSNSSYKSPSQDPNHKDFLNSNGVQEIILSNHTHLFTRANSNNNIKQSRDSSSHKERSSKNNSQYNNTQVNTRKDQEFNIEKKSNSSHDINKLFKKPSCLLYRQGSSASNNSVVTQSSTVNITQNLNNSPVKEKTLSAKLIEKSSSTQSNQNLLIQRNKLITNYHLKNKIIYK